MVFHCGECGKTHIKIQIDGFVCTRGRRECLKYGHDGKSYACKEGFEERIDICETCWYRGDPIIRYYCYDCKKWVEGYQIVCVPNESPDDDNMKQTQNNFILKNDDSDSTPEGE